MAMEPVLDRLEAWMADSKPGLHVRLDSGEAYHVYQDITHVHRDADGDIVALERDRPTEGGVIDAGKVEEVYWNVKELDE